jgi:hypothetical protein
MKVGKGDAITYVALVISAALLALEPWRKEAATPPDLHPVLSSPVWAYIPLALLTAVGVLWLFRQIGHLFKDRQTPVVTQNEAAATVAQSKVYSADPEGEALDKEAYNRIVAFCLDYLLPACEAQLALHRALIHHLCSNTEVADLAIAGSQSQWRYKTKGFWVNYFGLSDGLASTGGPQIKFDGIIEYIFELEREFYRNFFEHTVEIARTANVEPNSGDVAFSEWHKARDAHQKLVKQYEQIKRDIRFGKLHRLRPSRWGDMN